MPSGSAGLIGSINPSIPFVTSSGNPIATQGTSTLSGSYGLNILSPGASLNAGSAGVFLWVVVAIVGFVVLFRQ